MFYGLKGKPFQLNPDPEFFFASRGHARAYAYLQYGLHQSEGFIVVTGDVGTGKTTLVGSLLKRLDPAQVVAAQLVTTQLDAEDLLKSVAAAFGVPAMATQKAEVLAYIEAFLIGLATQGKRALLVVDEAQNLTPRAVEELRMLSNFQLENRSLLQSFLVGQPELRQLMQSPQMRQLRQRVIASYHLGPMDRKETQAYVEHRLRHVGWTGDPSFDAAAFDEIFTSCGGVPRRINTLANRLMLAAYLGERHAVSGTDVQSVLKEMRQELGPESAPLALAPTPGAGNPVVALPVPVGEVREVSGDSVAKLEARIARLEQLVYSTVSLLHTLIDREQRGKSSRNG
jgi:putative secretion ATPase (PEP-CTERM system associated)